MITRSGVSGRNRSSFEPTRVTPGSGPVTGNPFGPADRNTRPWMTTGRDRFSGKPGTPVRGSYPIDWEPR